MKSPFPGMDPYLEPHWLDVHTKLVAYTADELNRLLPEDLVARTEERVAVESDDEERLIGPDVRVFSPSTADPEEGEGGIVIEAPFKLVVQHDPITERFIRIIDEGGQLITVVEFISPTNKRGPGLDAYQQKRRELLDSNVQLVEVDLVRAGDWSALMRPSRCPARAVSPYRVTIRMPGRRRRGYLFPIGLQERLPAVPIPLRRSDPQVKIELQPLLDHVYENGRYGRTLDYQRLLQPRLGTDDAAWVDALLTSMGKK